MLASIQIISFESHSFSSPFLGTFFQLSKNWDLWVTLKGRFRPLSWGLSFNMTGKPSIHHSAESFRPLSWGLSFNSTPCGNNLTPSCFRPLSWGLSFNYAHVRWYVDGYLVFVPFLGDFLSIWRWSYYPILSGNCFRPLSWGLSFNNQVYQYS